MKSMICAVSEISEYTITCVHTMPSQKFLIRTAY